MTLPRKPLVGHLELGAPWTLAVIGAVAAVTWAMVDAHATPLDGPIFFEAADRLFSARWAMTFSDPGIQSGPLQLAAYGVSSMVARPLNVDPAVVLAALFECGSLVATALVVRVTIRRTWTAAWLVAAATVASGLVHLTFLSGHLAEGIIPLCWIAAAACARDRRPLLAGSLIAVAAGWEVWGMLGCSVLLLERDLRSVLRASATAAVGVALVFGPFFVLGDVGTFAHSWRVTSQSLWSYVVPVGTAVSWRARLLQAAVASLAGVAMVRFARSHRLVWEVPLVVVVTRLVVDPVNFGYYWLSAGYVLAVGVVDVAATMRSRGPRRPVAAARTSADALARGRVTPRRIRPSTSAEPPSRAVQGG